MKINIFDFDNTIYDGDSSTDFFLYCLIKKPLIIINIPRMLIVYILYISRIIDKTKMKENIFRYLKYIKDPKKLVRSFWLKKEKRIKKFYLERDHSKDVIISASPEFLLEDICKKMKVKKLIASKVNINDGKFLLPNCHDIEKVNRLNKEISNYDVEESYSDSLSDLPILKLAKKAYLVKKNKVILTDFNNY